MAGIIKPNQALASWPGGIPLPSMKGNVPGTDVWWGIPIDYKQLEADRKAELVMYMWIRGQIGDEADAPTPEMWKSCIQAGVNPGLYLVPKPYHTVEQNVATGATALARVDRFGRPGSMGFAIDLEGVVWLQSNLSQSERDAWLQAMPTLSARAAYLEKLLDGYAALARQYGKPMLIYASKTFLLDTFGPSATFLLNWENWQAQTQVSQPGSQWPWGNKRRFWQASFVASFAGILKGARKADLDYFIGTWQEFVAMYGVLST
jgi:hypothetical protein